MKGLSIDRIKVTVVFSGNLSAVTNAFSVQARQPGQFTESLATVTDLGNGTVACSFIFPHRDSPGAGGPIYNHPKTVHYAWAETLTTDGSTSELTSNSPVRSFVMPRFLIIGYIGDSYAAGEGAPNIQGFTTRQRWTDRDCHRSERSGGVLAIEQLKALHPELSVRYDNVTCSGATVANLNVDPQETRGFSRAAQLLQLKTWLRSEENHVVDILLADGGGNTAGFGPAGTAIMMPFHQNIVDNQKVKTRLENGLATLPGADNAVIQDVATERYFSVGRVVWMSYPTPLNDKEGNLCGPNTDSGARGLDCWTLLERGIKSDELTFVKVNLFDPLNAAVRDAVNTANLVAAQGGPYWDFVNVESLSEKNGLCNCRETDPVGYFNTLAASVSRQFDQFGTMHPNATGYRRIYRDAVFHQLEQSIALWHNELTQQPRRTGIAALTNSGAPGLPAGGKAASAKRRGSAQPAPQPFRMPRHMGTAPKLAPEDRLPVRPRVPDRPDN